MIKIKQIFQLWLVLACLFASAWAAAQLPPVLSGGTLSGDDKYTVNLSGQNLDGQSYVDVRPVAGTDIIGQFRPPAVSFSGTAAAGTLSFTINDDALRTELTLNGLRLYVVSPTANFQFAGPLQLRRDWPLPTLTAGSINPVNSYRVLLQGSHCDTRCYVDVRTLNGSPIVAQFAAPNLEFSSSGSSYQLAVTISDPGLRNTLTSEGLRFYVVAPNSGYRFAGPLQVRRTVVAPTLTSGYLAAPNNYGIRLRGRALDAQTYVDVRIPGQNPIVAQFFPPQVQFTAEVQAGIGELAFAISDAALRTQLNATGLDFYVVSPSAGHQFAGPLNLRRTPALPGPVTALLVPNPITNRNFTISWSAPSSGDVSGYDVQRRTGAGAWENQVLGTVSTSFTHTDVLQSNTYQFRVRACGPAGCSAYVESASVTAAGPLLSSGSSGCNNDAFCVRLNGSNFRSTTSVDIRDINLGPATTLAQSSGLTWVNNAQGNYLQLVIPSALRSAFQAQGLNFFAVNSDQGIFSNALLLNYVAPQVPGVVGNLSLPNPITHYQFTLSWTAPATGQVSGYDVERRIGGGAWTAVATGQSQTSYSNAVTLQTNTYQYRVRACGPVGCGAFAETVVASTTGPVLSSGTLACNADPFCVRLDGSNFRASTYVDLRDINLGAPTSVFQGAGLNWVNNAQGNYLQLLVPNALRTQFQSQGLHFFAVNHDQGMYSAALLLRPAAPPAVTLLATPATGLTAPAATTLSTTINPASGVQAVAYLAGGSPISCAGGVGAAPTHACNWTGIAAGSYQIISRVTVSGLSTPVDSAPLSLTVAPGTGLSATLMANPSSNLVAPANTVLSVALSAAAPAGTTVSYRANGNLIDCAGGVGAAPGFNCAWNGISAGNYALVVQVQPPAATLVSASLNLSVAPTAGGSLPPALSPAASSPPSVSATTASARVGSLDGSLRVAETGDLNFTMPFITAPGKGNVQPQLALHYGGSAALGIAGIGFNIQGVSGIARCRKTREAGDGPGPHLPVNFDADDSNDAFCLDGQRLIEVAASGSETIDGVVHAFREFRTEIESFQRVRAYASPAGASGLQLVYGPLFWRTLGKDGSLREYGRSYADLPTLAAAYANDGRVYNRQTPQLRVTDSRHHILSWALSRSGDRLGNAVRYRYETFTPTGTPEAYVRHLLSRVFYTRFDGAGAMAHEHAVLVFDYQDFDGAEVRGGWTSGSYSRLDRRLTRVRSCLRSNPAVAPTEAEWSASGSGLCTSQDQVLRVYKLGYERQADVAEYVDIPNRQLIPGQYGSGRMRLSTLTACADTAESICWPATRVNWAQARASIAPFTLANQGQQFQRAALMRFGDITGDNRPDIVWRERLTDNQGDKLWYAPTQPNAASGTAFLNGTHVTTISDDLDNDIGGHDPDRSWGLADINGDGLDDLINAESLSGGANSAPWSWYVRYARTDGGGFQSTRVLLPGASRQVYSAVETQFALSDSDGDGVIDLLFPTRIGGSTGNPERTILQSARGQRDANGRLSFGPATDVRLVFDGKGGTCYNVGFGRRNRADNWDSLDFNADERADLMLRVQRVDNCTSRVVGAITAGEYQFGLEPVTAIELPKPGSPEATAAANSAYWGLFVAADNNQFRQLGGPINAADVEGAVRISDLNGDGASDVVYHEPAYGHWIYQLNDGTGALGGAYCLVRNPTSVLGCLVTKLPNNSAPKSQVLLQDFNNDGHVDVWVSRDDPIDQISDGSERFKVHLWQRGSTQGGTETCNTTTISCSDFNETGIWTNALSGFSDTWGHLMVDLDADGFADSLTFKRVIGAPGAYILQRSGDHHQPRDVVVSLTSGYGLKTEFQYAPMSYGTVYTRDHNAYGLTDWGRGSVVVDVQGPRYVISQMATPAPTSADPNYLARMHYRYQGYKLQLGGRGGLGFRKVYTLNGENGVETTTEYQQRFPLTGRPAVTVSRLLNANGQAKWQLSCNPDVAGGCFPVTPRCSGGTCAHFSGEDANPALRGQTLSRATDSSTWRSRSSASPSYGNEGAALQAGVPAPLFVFTRSSLTETFENDPKLAEQVITSTQTDFVDGSGNSAYDDYGNLLASRSYSRAGSSLQQTVVNSSVYADDDPSRWLLGRMTSSSVTRIRPGKPPLTRTTEFDYDANGLLALERIQPGDAAMQLSKYTLYHRYGMPRLVYTCSKPVEDAGRCSSDFANAALAPAGHDNWVYRYEESGFDETTGLPTQAWVLRGSATPTRALASTTSFNKWGVPRQVNSTDAASATTSFDAFGRPVHQYADSGSQNTVLLRWCGEVSCPAGAVYRSELAIAGGGTSWHYSDGLGREILTLKTSFRQGQYSVSNQSFDSLGRKVRQAEPSLTSIGPEQASSLSLSSAFSTESCYDVGGRVIFVKLPNHTSAFSCQNLPTAAQQASITPDGNNTIQTIYRGLVTETINGLGQSHRTSVNAMGETVLTVDPNGFETEFAYDAFGNLQRVTRGVGTASALSTTTEYDVLGRRLTLVDPDAGTRYSVYNAAGESVREIDAKQQCLQSTRDFLGRVVRTEEYPAANLSLKTCSGASTGVTVNVYDDRKLGQLSQTSYGPSAAATEPGSVRIDLRYDSLGRNVSTRRCVVALSISRTDAQNCKIEKSAFDQYGRPYWGADAASENLVHDDSAYGSGSHRGSRMYYSEAGTSVNGINLNPGYMYKLGKLDDPATAYYEVLEVNAREQVTRERLAGNASLTTIRAYEGSTGRLTGIDTGNLQSLRFQYDELGNLRQRDDTSNGRDLREKFEDYDLLNRVHKAELLNAGLSQGVLNMDYTSDGNLIQKSGTGSYAHSSVSGYAYTSVAGVHGSSCAAGGPHAVAAIAELGYCHDANGNQVRSVSRANGQLQRIIAYTAFDKPAQVDSYEVGASGHSTKYGYGPGRAMAWRIDIPQFAGPLSQASVEIQYFGSVERELRRTGVPGQVNERYRRQLGGVVQVTEERLVVDAANSSSVVSSLVEIMLKDHLGSTHAVVNADGSNPQYHRFDVWGLRVEASSGATMTLAQAYQAFNPGDPGKARTRKGYTGHEMIDGAGIVHMQGRIYDPRLGRFLQADPLIQDPLNAQSYNRYTYVFNNPLSLTDPSGYRSLSANLELYWKPIVAIVIACVTGNYAYAAMEAGAIGTAAAWAVAGGAAIGLVTTGTLRGTVMGAVDGLLTFGIGQGFKGSWKALVLAHALKGGMLSALNGGDFGHGFVTAGLSKAVGFGVAKLDLNMSGEIVVQSLVGGTISELSGGKFANGAVSAALQFAFNAALSNCVKSKEVEDALNGNAQGGSDEIKINQALVASGDIQVVMEGTKTVLVIHIRAYADKSISEGRLQNIQRQIIRGWNREFNPRGPDNKIAVRTSFEYVASIEAANYRIVDDPVWFENFMRVKCIDFATDRKLVAGQNVIGASSMRTWDFGDKHGGNRTYAHEFGHGLGLHHPAGDGVSGLMAYGELQTPLNQNELQRLITAYKP